MATPEPEAFQQLDASELGTPIERVAPQDTWPTVQWRLCGLPQRAPLTPSLPAAAALLAQRHGLVQVGAWAKVIAKRTPALHKPKPRRGEERCLMRR